MSDLLVFPAPPSTSTKIDPKTRGESRFAHQLSVQELQQAGMMAGQAALLFLFLPFSSFLSLSLRLTFL